MPVGKNAVFEVVSVDPEKKRIGLTLVPEGSSRARAVDGAPDEAAATSGSEPGFGSLADKLRGALGPRQK